MQLRLLNVAVDGGDLRVLLWGTGKRVAVAVHGITASGMAWQAVARHMPPDWTLAAPDLRGRGHSDHLPGPYGLDRHARDVVAVLRHFGGRPVLAGHSMGAYIALLARDAHPQLVRRLVLVDGGLPLPVPEGIDLDATLDATLGPAIARLGLPLDPPVFLHAVDLPHQRHRLDFEQVGEAGLIDPLVACEIAEHLTLCASEPEEKQCALIEPAPE